MNDNKINSEPPAHYAARLEPTAPHIEPAAALSESDDDIIDNALLILASRLHQPGVAITCPGDTKDYLRLQLAEQQSEVFCAMFINNQHLKYMQSLVFHIPS